MTRRELLGGSLGLVGASLLPSLSSAEGASAPRLRFVHMTDLHVRFSDGAQEGVAMAVRKILSLNPRPAFVVVGGDAAEGLMGRTSAEAERWLNALQEWLKPLEMPVHFVVGNHDVVGWGKDGSSNATDPNYGKKAFADRFLKGPTYRSFDSAGTKFILLDSIQGPASPDPWPYRSMIDEAQLEWLGKTLATATKDQPIVVVTHSPLMSGYHTINDGTYEKPQARMLLENGKAVHEMLKKHAVKAVLQGHTHIRENLLYNGCQHITSGAICGSWWAGDRFDVDPAGFSVCDLLPDGSLRWEYVASGWRKSS